MENLPFPRLMSLLKYWREWPPENELLRGYVGYKPISEEEQKRRDQAASHAITKAIGPTVDYNSLPQWLRQAHARNKKT